MLFVNITVQNQSLQIPGQGSNCSSVGAVGWNLMEEVNPDWLDVGVNAYGFEIEKMLRQHDGLSKPLGPSNVEGAEVED